MFNTYPATVERRHGITGGSTLKTCLQTEREIQFMTASDSKDTTAKQKAQLQRSRMHEENLAGLAVVATGGCVVALSHFETTRKSKGFLTGSFDR